MADLLRFFHPVLKASRLGRKPVQVQVGEKYYVLFRTESGQLSALEDRCAHRLARLSGGCVKGEKIHCPYHDWSFDPKGKGYCPTQSLSHIKPVPSFQLQEYFGYLWLANHGMAISDLPGLGGDFDFLGSYDVLAKAPLHVVLANFSEDEHFPYVHGALGWTAADWPQVKYQAENFPDRTEVSYQGPQRTTPVSLASGLLPGDIFHNSWTTEFNPIRVTFDFYWKDKTARKIRPLQLKTTVYFVPEGEMQTRIHVFSFAKVAVPGASLFIMPWLRPMLLRAGRKEVLADAKFMKHVVHTPFDMSEMSLGRFDKPLVHNQKLMEQVYFERTTEKGSDKVQVAEFRI